MKEDQNRVPPLSPAVLHILLALASEDRHGYGIMLEVKRQSENRYKVGPGTLYDNLQKLMDREIVEEVLDRKGDGDARRRYYRLTKHGRRILSAEVSRLDELIREAKPPPVKHFGLFPCGPEPAAGDGPAAGCC